MTRGDKIILPQKLPEVGAIYRHYKGDEYKVVLLAEESEFDFISVVYEAVYPNPDFPYFVQSVKRWFEEVEWNGQKVERFQKI